MSPLINFVARYNLVDSRPGRLDPGKKPQYPLRRRLVGPHILSERYGEQKISWPYLQTNHYSSFDQHPIPTPNKLCGSSSLEVSEVSNLMSSVCDTANT